VAAVDLVGGGAHTLRREALQLGLHGAVISGHDIPARFGLPSRSCRILVNRCPNDLLLLFGQVSSEACDSFGEYPNAPVRDFDMRENVCGRKLVYVTLRGLAGVRGECGDINQPSNSVICSRGSDDGSAVRVADENRGAANAPQRAFYRGNVTFVLWRDRIGRTSLRTPPPEVSGSPC